MRAIQKGLRSVEYAQIVRYIINGLVATSVHFFLLTLNMQYFDMRSAGSANLIAAFFGISSSFIGSRYYVFKKHHEPILTQAMMFSLFYTSIAFLHWAVMYAWADMYGYDYRIGFLFATVMQVVLSYWGNKVLVFNA